MSAHPRDEFDDVPEDGERQGAHRGHNPNARNGSRREFRAILVTGLLALVLGAVCFVNAPRTEQGASVPAAETPATAVATSSAALPGTSPTTASGLSRGHVATA